MRKRAFTLIELLVVIAIIAILAAILFPVFAQAKEAAKKTQTLAQYKQIGTGTAIYLADYDDNFPLAMSYDSVGGAWRVGSFYSTPNGWRTNGNSHIEPRKTEEGAAVLNSIQPYVKNYQMYEGSGLPKFSYANTPATAGYTPPWINLSYNGMLHSWSGTAIQEISRIPMFWPGHMKNNLNGLAITSPILCCTNAGPACRFNASGAPQGGQTTCAYYGAQYGYVWWGLGASSNFTVWLYGRSTPFVMSDTSAKMLNLNAPIWPAYAENVNVNPFSSFAPGAVQGSPYWMSDCVAPGSNKSSWTTLWFYPGYFRPDNDFNWQLSECDFGGG